MVKKIIGTIIILALICGSVGWYEWHKSATKVEDVKGISIPAAKLSKEYSTNEKAADSIYLNKVIEVSGAVGEIDTNQDGNLMIVLQTDDPMAGVQCTMRDKGIAATKGTTITVKGYCSGNGITGVSLTQCAIKQ
jgi:hypothetical protein